MAGRARRIHARQEQQLDEHEPLALARLAAPLGHVEREAARIVVPRARRLRGGEELPHVIEQPGVGRQVGARRAADRLLIHPHQPLDPLHARRRCARRSVSTTVRSSSSPSSSSGGGSCPSSLRHQLHQRLAHQARLARAGHAGHRGEHAERELRRRGRAGCCASRPPAAASPSGRRGVRAARRPATPNRYCRVRDASTSLSPAGGPL